MVHIVQVHNNMASGQVGMTGGYECMERWVECMERWVENTIKFLLLVLGDKFFICTIFLHAISSRYPISAEWIGGTLAVTPPTNA